VFLFTCLLITLVLILGYFLYRSTSELNSLKHQLEQEVASTIHISEQRELLNLTERISQIGTWELLLESQQVKWSEGLYKLYGFQTNDFKPTFQVNEDIVAPDFREKVKKELNSAVNQKRPFAVEYQILQPSGSRKYVLSQGYFIEQGNRLVGTVQDITLLKEATLKLKINESLLREAEAVSHSGSWEWMEGSEYILCSDEMYRIHGHLPHSVFVNLPFYLSMVYEPDRVLFISAYTDAYKKRGPFKINYRIVSPNGDIKHLLSTAEFKRISLNDQYAYIGNTQDVTLLREAQVQLEEKMIELSRSNKDLEQFAYVASHDLQEPLRKIQAFGQRLKQSYADDLGIEAVDYLDRMYSAATRMRKLIDDLLAYSQVTRVHKNFLEVNLATIIETATKELDYQIELHKAVISVNAEVTIDGLPPQLLQLFINLLGNSLKFIQTKAIPMVTVQAFICDGQELTFNDAIQGQKYCLIEVRDNGIGFDAADAEKIFDIFQRLNPRSAFEGTGIGLAICKKIVENHSGFISAEGMPESGSTFTIALPVKHSKYSK
jgi:signal transduction histidine kinase